MCQRFNSLPSAGGLFDQDAFLVEVMTLVAYYQGVKDERDAKALRDKYANKT